MLLVVYAILTTISFLLFSIVVGVTLSYIVKELVMASFAEFQAAVSAAQGDLTSEVGVLSGKVDALVAKVNTPPAETDWQPAIDAVTGVKNEVLSAVQAVEAKIPS